MNRSRQFVMLHLILFSIANLGLPILAMLVLQPAQYGAFSLVYLAGALANTLQLSTVSEVWVRAGTDTNAENSWNRFSNATILVGVAGGAVAAVVALTSTETRPYWPLLFVAVFAQVYANGSSFRALRLFDWRYVLPSGALGSAAVLASAVALFALPTVGLLEVLLSWVLVKVAMLLGARPPRRIGVRESFAWLRTNKKDITTLVSDGAIANLSNLGPPYMVAPILGLAHFGTYRALENLSAPMRTVISSLRPALTRLPLRRLGSVRLAVQVGLGSLLIGVIAFLALRGLEYTGLDLGTLNSLYPYAPLVALYMTAITLWNLYPLLARQVAASRHVITLRASLSVVAVLGPVGGALGWGLPGALWGQIIHVWIAALAWWILVNRSVKDA
ncbi:hypothetical protein FM125_07185 [Micrococcus lylae]|uniref:Polysaccharide biosynthesis protein n=1 Tax=Micrococcus lylae TaxID=1273 RepID=A0A1R4J9S1_9MICC|nr:hypothetical protein [Micrococcus lylae]SJN28555.1 hypothetical protein FM125_07185 [Micrococcus lylae]